MNINRIKRIKDRAITKVQNVLERAKTPDFEDKLKIQLRKLDVRDVVSMSYLAGREVEYRQEQADKQWQERAEAHARAKAEATE